MKKKKIKIDFKYSTLFFPQLKEFDREIECFSSHLFEFPISFPPSYPFEEDPCLSSAAHSYMKTRCPAWCDRVVLSLTAKALVHDVSMKSVLLGGVQGTSGS